MVLCSQDLPIAQLTKSKKLAVTLADMWLVKSVGKSGRGKEHFSQRQQQSTTVPQYKDI